MHVVQKLKEMNKFESMKINISDKHFSLLLFLFQGLVYIEKLQPWGNYD